MKENYDRSLASVKLWEGGNASRPNEPGGAVSRGISLQKYREKHPQATADDLFNAPDGEIDAFYRDIWDALKLDQVSSGYDALMLHCATMFGINGARHFDEAAKGDYALLVILMMHNKMHRPDGLKFMPGWSDRFLAIYQLAKELA